jgi:hypothetical protein
MMVNKNRPHVLVLPEDDADRQLANGFHLEVGSIRQMQVLQVAGGWRNVLARFKSNHESDLRRYSHRYMVLLIDFDNQEDRLNIARNAIPDDLKDRVFVLGAQGEPEDLRRAGLGSPETIGKALARDCREETNETWGHDLLKHNANELDRLREQIGQILFQSS